MQYILTEDEMKVFKRCKSDVQGQYNSLRKQRENDEEKAFTEFAEHRYQILRYLLGETDVRPDVLSR